MVLKGLLRFVRKCIFYHQYQWFLKIEEDDYLEYFEKGWVGVIFNQKDYIADLFF